jgi:iron complex transport system ATP-binding protein
MTTAAIILEFERLALRVAGRTLVRDLDLSVRRGEVWCVLGANGAGKSSLLEAVVGLRTPARGRIRLAGRPLADWPLREAARLRAWLPQRVRDAFGATVLEVAMLGRPPHRSRWGWDDDADAAIALDALEVMGVGELAERDVMTLSGGERQRVGIAAALAQETPLVVLDEPVSHLDLRHQLSALAHLGRLASQRGRAVVLSIHDLNLAARVATHALLIGEDGVTAAGPFDEVASEERISAAFGHPVVRHRAGPYPVFVAA